MPSAAGGPVTVPMPERALGRHGPFLAAMTAVLAGLPGLRLPFLSDDWAVLDATRTGVPLTTFAHDFRPLFMLTYWLDRRMWGLSPALFHLTNLSLAVWAAALVVFVVRRLTGDGALAGLAGIFFAAHPYHVECTGWIAARADPLYSVFLLLATLAYDSWRPRKRALPWLALLLLEAALLCKETAVVLPLLLVGLSMFRRDGLPDGAEWRRGFAPLFLLTASHIFALRWFVLGGPGRTLLEGVGAAWMKRPVGYAAAAILPVDAERFLAQPLLWGATAGLTLAGLLLVCRARSGRLPAVCGPAGVSFFILLSPALVSFQERYLFLPVAASSVLLAALVLGSRGKLSLALGATVIGVWLGLGAIQWRDWFEAAEVSGKILDGLTSASARSGVEEIVVANLPFRVRGGSVAGDFQAALGALGARPIPVRALSYLDLPGSLADGIDPKVPVAMALPGSPGEVRLRIAPEPFSRYIGPPPPQGERRLVTSCGEILFGEDGSIVLRIPRLPGGTRAAYAWEGGLLRELF